MPTPIRLPLNAVLALLLLLPAFVEAATWRPVGPPGGDVRSLAADPRDPRRVYLGTADGVLYRSDDAARSWRRMEPGFPERGQSLDDLVVDPNGVLYVAYWTVSGGGGGIARSVDGGKSFTILSEMTGRPVRALAIAASDPRVLVAGASDGVFRSKDSGRHWDRITPRDHPELRNLDSVAIDPADADVIYVGTWHLPWKTTDAGDHWTRIHTGMIDDSDVMTMTIDRRSSQRVYATACTGIYRSMDGAGRWSKVQGIPASSRRTRAFAQDPGEPDVFYAGTTEGLWVSRDGAQSFRVVTAKDLVVNAILVLPGGGLVLGTEGAGVLRSTDEGATWTASNDGFSERFVSRVVVDSATGRVLVGVLGDRRTGGVLEARGASPWRALGRGLEGREVLGLVLRNGQPLAGTDDGIYAWAEGEDRWRRLTTLVGGFDPHPRVTDLAVTRSGRILAATGRGLLTSIDGEAWTRVTLGLAGTASAVAADGRRALAATPTGIFGSADAGLTWTPLSAPISEGVHGLTIVPGQDVVFATTSRGLLRSADLGRSWTLCTRGLPPTDVIALGVHPDGQTVYAGDFGRGGLFRSTDGGLSWAPLPSDGLLSTRVWTMAVDAASERLFAASPAGGLHVMTTAETGAATATGGAGAGP